MLKDFVNEEYAKWWEHWMSKMAARPASEFKLGCLKLTRTQPPNSRPMKAHVPDASSKLRASKTPPQRLKGAEDS
jgi:hypothetical protein